MQKWTNYTIMHRDREVASICSDGSCVIHDPSFMPYNLYLEPAQDMNSRINNLENFYHWCASRVLTLDRKYAKEILNSLGQKQSVTDRDRAQIAIAYHGVTMTDVFWIKGECEQITFADINLYDHSLSDAFVDVALRGRQLTAQNAELLKPLDAAGDVSTVGVAPKAWVRRDGVFYLLKDGDRRDVEAELLASKIARCFDVEQVLYEASMYDGELVTESRLITSVDYSIVPMEYVDIFAVNHDTDSRSLVMKHDPYSYYMMNIIDYLTGNTDRHWANWGFKVDNRNNRLMKLYALMDFNKAFTAYDTLEGTRCQTAQGNISQREAAVEAVQKVGLNQIAEVKREWFEDNTVWDMFNKRLNALR